MKTLANGKYLPHSPNVTLSIAVEQNVFCDKGSLDDTVKVKGNDCSAKVEYFRGYHSLNFKFSHH